MPKILCTDCTTKILFSVLDNPHYVCYDSVIMLTLVFLILGVQR